MRNSHPLNQVKDFHVHGKTVVVCGDDIRLTYLDGSDTVIVEEPVWASLLFSNKLLFQNENGQQVKVLCLDEKVCYPLNKDMNFYLFKSLLDNDALYVQSTDTSVLCFDRSLQLLSSYQFGRMPKMINKDYFFRIPSTTVVCHSLSTGAELWKVDVGELGQYEDMKGQIVKGEVSEVFALGDTVVAKVKASVLVGYSVEGGKQRWLHRFGSGNVYLLALYEGVFYVFADLYYEIDGASGQILAKKPYRELFAEANFKDYWLTAPAVSDKYIAISSHYDSAILLINRSTFTVEQRIALEGCKSGIPLSNAPRLYGNRLYQLDGDGTLHIFEEQE